VRVHTRDGGSQKCRQEFAQEFKVSGMGAKVRVGVEGLGCGGKSPHGG